MMHTREIRLDKGAKNNTPKRIIIHAMSEFINYKGQTLHAVEFLKLIGLSAHVLVEPNGTIIRCREDSEGAYHAKGHNTDTLGVEFLIEGIHSYAEFLEAMKKPYLTEDQIDSGFKLVKGWMIRWNIHKNNVLMHSDIDPERKYDAGQGFIDSGFFNMI